MTDEVDCLFDGIIGILSGLDCSGFLAWIRDIPCFEERRSAIRCNVQEILCIQ